MAVASSQDERVVAQSNNRRRGWVIASEDGTDLPRPTSFDARSSAAAWNKGKGPSQRSIPSRASSLTTASAPSPTIPNEPLRSESTDTPLANAGTPDMDITPPAPVPPPRIYQSSMSHNREGTSSTASEAESSTGRRRPSPPLLVPPKQTFRKVPSTRVLPASALSDHQKFMAAARTSPSGTASSTASGPSVSRSPWANAALRSDLAKLAASRRANSSSSSSTATTSSVATVTEPADVPATSDATTASIDPHGKGKGKEVLQSPLQRDSEGFFSSDGKARSSKNAISGNHDLRRNGEMPSAAGVSTPNQQAKPPRIQAKPSLAFSVNPLPPLSEKSANSDIDETPSPTSDLPSEGGTPSAAKLGQRQESLQIELPPPPPQFKDRYPSILVDSTHVSDSEASGTSIGVQRRRRRRSTASSNKLDGDGEDDDDEYADDDSSWPSTPSTTPLEMYFTSDDARTKPARRTMQTTQEIIAPNAGALGMGRPMVVVTSPSTASEVSSDRRSSSGSGSTSERTYSSSPPAVASIAPAPALSKIEEHPAPKDNADPKVTVPPRRSLSFEIPAVPRSRTSEENLTTAAPVRSPSRAMAFLAKMNPSKTANRSSVDSALATRPNATATSSEVAKRMSLDNHPRTSAEQRRSVELRPILLNATPRPLVAEAPITRPIPSGSNATAEQIQQRRRSIGRAAIRRNVVPYHSRRESEVSVDSSAESCQVQDRGSFDKVTFDPKYSPASQVTALTMPSPAIAQQKLDSQPHSNAAPSGINTSDARSSAPIGQKDRFAASMPSLHQPAAVEQASERRSPSDGQAEHRPSAIRLLVDSHKGRMTRDNDSIAEWISVSVNDLPRPDGTQAYGNGGAGDYSNKKQQQGKKEKKNKPWKFGRFAASEVVLPSKAASPAPKRRSASFVKRASSEQVHAAPRTSVESTTPPLKGPFMRNLGFTTANRNVVLQNLCAERSISALAATTIHIAGSGRINVPQPTLLLASKAKAKPKAAKATKQSQDPKEEAKVPVVLTACEVSSPSHTVEESHDAYLNASEDRRIGYNLSDAAVSTVKSMVPELGDWSGSSRHKHGSSAEVLEVRPFRDYEDEGSDLFDSERSESDSESEEEMDYDDEDEGEDVEVPVRFGQRVNLSNRAGSGFYGMQTPAAEEACATAKGAVNESPSLVANTGKIVPSSSFERLTPGTLMLHGDELRICVEEEELSGRTARPLAYWKVVEVQQPQTSPPVEHHLRRQPSSNVMKFEQEVATGIFAAFVGNRSPRRQVQRSSVDAGSSNADQGSPEKRSAAKTDVKELLVSKVNKGTFTVRSEVRSTSEGTEQVVEIIRHQRPRGASHPTQPSESSRASMVSDRLERAFPSPLYSNNDLANDRTRSNRNDGTVATLEDGIERIRIGIQSNGRRGFAATFHTRDGRQWSWQGSKLEASVLSPKKEPSESKALEMLEGYDFTLQTVNGSETLELATYSTDSQVRNALGLFKPRTKSVPKQLPEDASSIGAPIPPPTQVVPLAIPIRGVAVPNDRMKPQIPLRGIRGGPLLRSQPNAAGSAPRHHGLWQHQRAVIPNEAVVQVHNNAVNNVRDSLLLNDRRSEADKGLSRTSSEEKAGNKKMGVLSFSSVDSLDRDLVVLSLLAVMGVARV